jgi:hypothetical protein
VIDELGELEELAGLMEMKEPTGVAEIHSSAADFRQFAQGTIWQDVKRELLVWHEMMGRVYDTLKPSDDDFMSDFSRAQGRRETIEYVLTLPELMIEALEVEKEEDDADRRDSADDG